MASNMPTKTSSPGLARPHFPVFPSGDTDVLDFLVDGIRNKLLGGYHAVQQAVSRCIPHATPRTATPEACTVVELQSQPVDSQEATNVGQESESTLGHPLNNRNPFTSEGDDLEEISQPAVPGEYGSNEVPSNRPKRSWMWVAAVIVGLLFLIMLPGLILGVVTKQIAWAIAISGAAAPAVVFFGGLFIHHKM